MFYADGGPVDPNGRLKVCPVCKNTEFSSDADYCRICGTDRKNWCLPDDEHAPRHLNPSNARFCEQCGARTVFFDLGLLSPWDKVPEKMKKEASASESTGFTKFSEYELPF